MTEEPSPDTILQKALEISDSQERAETDPAMQKAKEMIDHLQMELESIEEPAAPVSAR